ncbi:MAG: metal-dependent transcriptional regulator [Cyclobacteriaceae bacterium]
MVTSTEENYLKSIYHLSFNRNGKGLGTKELAVQLNIAPTSVSNMLKKLKEKDLIIYEKYGGIALSSSGEDIAMFVIRKHRLWETFLVEKMGFTWDEIHEVAEQLEHIKSNKLIDRLDEYLGYPEYDPHGDPIPKVNGQVRERHKTTLDLVEIGKHISVVGVKNDSPVFLQHITQLGLTMKSKIVIKAHHEFDDLLDVEIEGKSQMISPEVAKNIYVAT